MKINIRVIRYILVILTIVILTYAVQIFVQNFNIEENIRQLKNKQEQLSGETYWMKNYYQPYLNTMYAQMIMYHKAGIIQDNEKIVKIVTFLPKEEEKKINTKRRVIKNQNNSGKCIDYFVLLLKKYF